MVAMLLGAAGCGFLNPLGETQDGQPPRARLRMGVASATFETDCSEPRTCWVQLELAHSDPAPHRIEILAVHVVDHAGRGGPVPIGAPLRWHGDAYGAWDPVLPPSYAVKASIPIEQVAWPRLLGERGHGARLYEQDLWVVVEVDCDGERLTTRSIFSVRATPERPIIMT